MVPSNIFAAMLNDRLVAKGTVLEVLLVFFQVRPGYRVVAVGGPGLIGSRLDSAVPNSIWTSGRLSALLPVPRHYGTDSCSGRICPYSYSGSSRP